LASGAVGFMVGLPPGKKQVQNQIFGSTVGYACLTPTAGKSLCACAALILRLLGARCSIRETVNSSHTERNVE